MLFKAAREVYGMGLAQAKAFVDDLQGRPRPADENAPPQS